MADIKYVYLYAKNALSKIIDEKSSLFEDLIYFAFAYTKKFSYDKFYIRTMVFIYEYYYDLFAELNREHDIYEIVINYLAEASDAKIHEIMNSNTLDDLDNSFIKLETLAEHRDSDYLKFYSYYLDLLDEDSLTDMNYRFVKYKEYLTEEKYSQLLQIINK